MTQNNAMDGLTRAKAKVAESKAKVDEIRNKADAAKPEIEAAASGLAFGRGVAKSNSGNAN